MLAEADNEQIEAIFENMPYDDMYRIFAILQRRIEIEVIK